MVDEAKIWMAIQEMRDQLEELEADLASYKKRCEALERENTQMKDELNGDPKGWWQAGYEAARGTDADS